METQFNIRKMKVAQYISTFKKWEVYAKFRPQVHFGVNDPFWSVKWKWLSLAPTESEKFVTRPIFSPHVHWGPVDQVDNSFTFIKKFIYSNNSEGDEMFVKFTL